MKTLSDVVSAVVKEMVACGDSFSSHDVTCAVREYANASPDEVAFGSGYCGNDHYTNVVHHEDVKQLIGKMYRNGELTRQFNGTYFVYSGNASTPVPAPDQKLVDKVKEIIEETLSIPPACIQMDADIHNDLGADSIDLVELTMAFEEEFDITIEDDDAEKITTLSEMCSLIKKLVDDPFNTSYKNPWCNNTNNNTNTSNIPSKVSAEDIIGYINRNGSNTVRNIQKTVGGSVDELVKIATDDDRLLITTGWYDIPKSYYILSVD